nr:hypothetical protein CFP56_61687 [Quercus suber]
MPSPPFLKRWRIAHGLNPIQVHIKEFDRQAKDLDSRNDPDTNKMLICFQFVVDTDVSNLEIKRIDLFDGGTEGYGEDNV